MQYLSRNCRDNEPDLPEQGLKPVTCNSLIPVFQGQVYTDIYTHRNEYGILFTQTLPATFTEGEEIKCWQST
ncbi:hypothetical protein A3860_20460 [Niastella vici]|uniref:Uncharacterized protein n=1 Tax=Niastella vici TaxID=1703345 RepID=A0A1V9G1A1_9BACT|nr:hypothetical protein A3860_20460 [Niastella vici]